MAISLKSVLAKKEIFEYSYCEIHAVSSDFKVAKLRQDMNLTQSQFAEMLGISPRTLEAWEQGRRNPSTSARVLLKAADDKVRNRVA